MSAPGPLKNWQSRHIALRRAPLRLTWHEEAGGEARGELLLGADTAVRAGADGTLFHVSSGGRELVLRAPSDAEAADVNAALRTALAPPLPEVAAAPAPSPAPPAATRRHPATAVSAARTP